jgi:hypothetical protein
MYSFISTHIDEVPAVAWQIQIELACLPQLLLGGGGGGGGGGVTDHFITGHVVLLNLMM